MILTVLIKAYFIFKDFSRNPLNSSTFLACVNPDRNDGPPRGWVGGMSRMRQQMTSKGAVDSWEDSSISIIGDNGTDRICMSFFIGACITIQRDQKSKSKIKPLSTSMFCEYFVWFNSLRPINNLSVKQGQVFLGWTSTKLGLMCLAQGPQSSDAGEAGTRSPPVSSQALYHWATALLCLVSMSRIAA